MPTTPRPTPADLLDAPTRQFYVHALKLMDDAAIPYCVAGAYALAAHAGIVRHTKDLDIFLKRADLPRATAAFAEAGYRIEHTHPHWLAKAYAAEPVDAFVDFIFRAASGIWQVDDEWLAHAKPGDVVGTTSPLCPVEELIWSKAMVMDRNRFDGTDIAHVVYASRRAIDWDRLLHRAAGHEGVLLGHLAFVKYVYPAEPDCVPFSVLATLLSLLRDQPVPTERVCRGTLLSWNGYLFDVNDRGMIDGRLEPFGTLTPAEIAQWTAAEK